MAIWEHWSIGLYPQVIGDSFLRNLYKIRTLYLAGFLGSGKTLLSYYLAARSLATGDCERIVSNIASPLATTADRAVSIKDSVVILDEAHQFLSSRAAAVSYGAALRKLGVLLLMPSVFPPAALLSSFSCTRKINYYVIGIPIWQYHYTLRARGFLDEDDFFFLNPHLVTGWFDTELYPGDDWGISSELDSEVAALKALTAERLGKKSEKGKITQNRLAEVKKLMQEGKSARESYDTVLGMEEVGDVFASAADKIAHAASKIRR